MESSVSNTESIQQIITTEINILLSIMNGILTILTQPCVYIPIIIMIIYYTSRRIYRREPNIIKKII